LHRRTTVLGQKIALRQVWAFSTGFVRRYHEQAYLLAKGNPHKPPVLLPSVLEWRYTTNALHPTQKPVGAVVYLSTADNSIGPKTR